MQQLSSISKRHGVIHGADSSASSKSIVETDNRGLSSWKQGLSLTIEHNGIDTVSYVHMGILAHAAEQDAF